MRGSHAYGTPVQAGVGAGPHFAAAPEQHLLYITEIMWVCGKRIVLTRNINIAGANGMPKRGRGS